ncbi:MAG: polynucleotide 5'-hydroxyl-kinase [Actinomycetota bacterium]|nr:polynucleotide 5'-hydroxyl-kinase [Actinomycetota bacterium]
MCADRGDPVDPGAPSLSTPAPIAPAPLEVPHDAHSEVVDGLLERGGVVFLVGGIDTGKTTFGLELVRRAASAGLPAAFVDADIGQSTVGPPTTIGLKLCRNGVEVTRASVRAADALAFVGSITPPGYLLPLVGGTAKMVGQARASGCRLIVVDSTGYVSGIGGQLLKFYKADAVQPDVVVGFRRGGELEPVLGHARRFTPAEVMELEVPPEVMPRPADDRTTYREQQFAAYFASGSSRWKIKPSVFMPALPPEFDLALLDGLVVGLDNGGGSCPGIGVLEYGESADILRMVSPVTSGVKGLRLGSIKIDIRGRLRGPVNLRQLFRTE